MFKNTNKKDHPVLKSILKYSTVFILVFILVVSLLSWKTYKSLGELTFFVDNFKAISGDFGQEEKTYLIILQNNNELRPSGGFISSFSTLTLEKGLKPKLEIKDVYFNTENQHPFEAPYPMANMLKPDNDQFNYTFRDSNYFADFPTSAKVISTMYMVLSPEKRIDGIISVNFSVLEKVLSTIGDLSIDGKTVTSSSLFEDIEYNINSIDKHNVEDLKNRKQFLNKILSALIEKIKRDPDLLFKLVPVFTDCLNQKDIQLFFEDSSLETKVIEKQWAGAWNNKSSDFIAFVEANLGGLKSDRYINRSVDYHVKFEKDETGKIIPKATVQITLQHFGLKNLPISGQYSGFLRTYIPLNSEITAHTDQNYTLSHSQDNLIMGNIISIKPGESATLNYSYTLPSSVLDNGKYSLSIPKQSGANNDFYNVLIEFPQGYKLESDSFNLKENFASYRGQPTKDLNLSLSVLPEQNPPFVVRHEFSSLKSAEIIYNKPVELQEALNAENYQITDTDTKNSTHDQITVKTVEKTEDGYRLLFDGMTEQYEEYYHLSLKNIKDLDGNDLNKETSDLTLVQRIKP